MLEVFLHASTWKNSGTEDLLRSFKYMTTTLTREIATQNECIVGLFLRATTYVGNFGIVYFVN